MSFECQVFLTLIIPLCCGSLNAGHRLNDDLLNLIALRYGSTSGPEGSGVITLENFISLILRLESTNRESIQTCLPEIRTRFMEFRTTRRVFR